MPPCTLTSLKLEIAHEREKFQKINGREITQQDVFADPELKRKWRKYQKLKMENDAQNAIKQKEMSLSMKKRKSEISNILTEKTTEKKSIPATTPTRSVKSKTPKSQRRSEQKTPVKAVLKTPEQSPQKTPHSTPLKTPAKHVHMTPSKSIQPAPSHRLQTPNKIISATAEKSKLRSPVRSTSKTPNKSLAHAALKANLFTPTHARTPLQNLQRTPHQLMQSPTFVSPTPQKQKVKSRNTSEYIPNFLKFEANVATEPSPAKNVIEEKLKEVYGLKSPYERPAALPDIVEQEDTEPYDDMADASFFGTSLTDVQTWASTDAMPSKSEKHIASMPGKRLYSERPTLFKEAGEDCPNGGADHAPEFSDDEEFEAESRNPGAYRKRSTATLKRNYKANIPMVSKNKKSKQSEEQLQNFGPMVSHNFVKLKLKTRGQPFSKKDYLKNPMAAYKSGKGGPGYIDPVEDEQSIPNVSTRPKYKGSNISWIDVEPRLPVTVCEREICLLAALEAFCGLTSFRTGQVDIIRNILNGVNTAVIMPTGSGKSLCYQLSAFILHELSDRVISIVISPTISLMQDQILNAPDTLKAVAWHSVTSLDTVRDQLHGIRHGAVGVLYVSPEKLQSSYFISCLTAKGMPRVGFVCVDEAHCVSEWSHNFRPAYLQIKRSLVSLGSPVVLAATATATQSTMISVCDILSIDPSNIIRGQIFADQVQRTISIDSNRKQALASLLTTPRFKSITGGIIVYCMKQKDADELASYLLGNHSLGALSYHAGRTPAERKRIIRDFNRNEPSARILCATIAFGMGIDKPDIGAVLHYSMPKSLENYVQETGRAGRNGESALAHMFLDDKDFYTFRSWAQNEMIEPSCLRSLFTTVFESAQTSRDAKGHRLVIFANVALEKISNLPSTAVLSILTYMQSLSNGEIVVTPNVKKKLTAWFNGVSADELAASQTIVHAFVTVGKAVGKVGFEVDVERLCNAAGLSYQQLCDELDDLKTSHQVGFKLDVDAIAIDLTGSYIGKLDDKILDSLADQVFEHVKNLNAISLEKIWRGYCLFKSCAMSNYSLHFDDFAIDEDPTSSGQVFDLNTGISTYFEEPPEDLLPRTGWTAAMLQIAENQAAHETSLLESVERDVSRFVNTNLDRLDGGGVIVARIFHGLYGFQMSEWYRDKLWGSHKEIDFQVLSRMASDEILRQKHPVTRSNTHQGGMTPEL